MLKNDLKVAFRNLLKHKGHSIINISGLAIGITACLLLFLWVQDELSYDRYHENANRICRVAYQLEMNGKKKRIASTPAPLGPALVHEFPWIERLGSGLSLPHYFNATPDPLIHGPVKVGKHKK